ncbi:MAG: hypothetical protein K0B15_13630 [Lentimicrobium sp.]|nr:hypothetical protein [Lentimicrobium sp.]
MKIEESLKLGIKESNLTLTSYSRGNRALDIRNRDSRIVLYDVAGYEIMEISKSGSTESARVRLEELAGHLGIGLI